VVTVDLGDDVPDEVSFNAFEAKQYFSDHRPLFEAKYGADWAGPLVAAFLGRPFTPVEWPEGRAIFIIELVLGVIAEAKKAVPASATPSPPVGTAA
jgi:hypothetical protein